MEVGQDKWNILRDEICTDLEYVESKATIVRDYLDSCLPFEAATVMTELVQLVKRVEENCYSLYHAEVKSAESEKERNKFNESYEKSLEK